MFYWGFTKTLQPSWCQDLWKASTGMMSQGKEYTHRPGIPPNRCNDLQSVDIYQSSMIWILLTALQQNWSSHDLSLFASCWFLVWLIHKPWRWRLHVPLKRRSNFNGLHARYILGQRTIRIIVFGTILYMVCFILQKIFMLWRPITGQPE
jgi:hypothetical protein